MTKNDRSGVTMFHEDMPIRRFIELVEAGRMPDRHTLEKIAALLPKYLELRGPVGRDQSEKNRRFNIFATVFEMQQRGLTLDDAIDTIAGSEEEAAKIRRWYDKGAYSEQRRSAEGFMRSYKSAPVVTALRLIQRTNDEDDR